jgi:hypothetical protein
VETSLTYRVISRTARMKQRNPNKEKEKKKFKQIIKSLKL